MAASLFISAILTKIAVKGSKNIGKEKPSEGTF
jgi:hypothetical protein